MEAVGVVDRRMRIWRPLEGWLRMTGILRSAWEGESLMRYLHPCDGQRLIDLHRQMDYGPGFAVLRIGAYGRWEYCEVSTSGWTPDGAAIAIKRMPPAGAETATGPVDYLYLDPYAEELLETRTGDAEGTPWRSRIHPVDLDLVNGISAGTHAGGPGVVAQAVRAILPDGSTRLFEAWTYKDGGHVVGIFRPLEVAQVVSRGERPFAGLARLPKTVRA